MADEELAEAYEMEKKKIEDYKKQAEEAEARSKQLQETRERKRRASEAAGAAAGAGAEGGRPKSPFVRSHEDLHCSGSCLRYRCSCHSVSAVPAQLARTECVSFGVSLNFSCQPGTHFKGVCLQTLPASFTSRTSALPWMVPCSGSRTAPLAALIARRSSPRTRLASPPSWYGFQSVN